MGMVGRTVHQRYHDRTGERDPARPDPPLPRQSANAVLAMQRTIGNRGNAEVLARQADENQPSFEHSVKVGKLGPIEIKGGNVADWAAKKDPNGLKVISAKGKHSHELARLFESKA